MLFLQRKRIEELGRLLGASQLRNTVEREHGLLHLIDGCQYMQHRTLWEAQLTWSYAHVLRFRKRTECIDGRVSVLPNGQPDFPPEWSFPFCRERFFGVRP